MTVLQFKNWELTNYVELKLDDVVAQLATLKHDELVELISALTNQDHELREKVVAAIV